MADCEATDPAGARGDLESALVDVSGLTLREIAELPDSVLGAALRRLGEAADRSDDLFNTDYKEGAS